MDLIESLIYMLWRGIAIGVLISAPMGPVGILCIQRTLDKGRRTGLYTGVGAAISDLFYCLLTGFGLSFIEDFIERNQNVIQLIGSAVLIGFGLYLFKKDPRHTIRKPDIEECSPKKNILGGFLFTFSNPLILFLIIGLFARFNFLVPGMRFYHYIVGFIGIIAGALGWWWIVTYVVDKVRSKFSLRTLSVINKVIGVIILIFAVVGIVTGVSNLAHASSPPLLPITTTSPSSTTSLSSPTLSTSPSSPTSSTSLSSSIYEVDPPKFWNKGRGYAPFTFATTDGVLLDNHTAEPLADSVTLTLPSTLFRLDFRADNRHGHHSRRYSYTDSNGTTRYRTTPPWALFLSDTTGQRLWLTIDMQETSDGPLNSSAATHITLSCAGLQEEITLDQKTLPFAGESLWSIESDGSYLRVTAGANSPTHVADFPYPLTSTASFGFVVSPAASILISDIAFRPASTLSTIPTYDLPFISQTIEQSDDPLEGYWEIFDRNIDESLIKLGGEYKIAVVKNHDRYFIIYMDGARVNKGRWIPGMLKGILSPSSFPDLYNLEWIDAEGQPLYHTLTAQTGAGNTLTLQFPYQASTIRLRKAPGTIPAAHK